VEIGRSSDGKYSLSVSGSRGREIDAQLPVTGGGEWAKSGYFKDIDLSAFGKVDMEESYRKGRFGYR
jgi:hypothetical protein